MIEDQGNKGKWTSHAQTWTIDKSFTGTGVHIDTKNRIIRMNPKNSWVRLETQDLIHVYTWKGEDLPAGP